MRARPRWLVMLATGLTVLPLTGAAAEDREEPVALIVHTRAFTWDEVRRHAFDYGAVPPGRQAELLQLARLELAKEYLLYFQAQRLGHGVREKDLQDELDEELRGATDKAQLLEIWKLRGIRSMEEYRAMKLRKLTIQRYIQSTYLGPEAGTRTGPERQDLQLRPTDIEAEVAANPARYSREVKGELWYIRVDVARTPDAATEATRLVEALRAATPFETIRAGLATRGLTPAQVALSQWDDLPADPASTLFPPASFPRLNAALKGLAAGAVAEPVSEGDAWHLLRLVRAHRLEARPRADIWADATGAVRETQFRTRQQGAVREAARAIAVWPPEVRDALRTDGIAGAPSTP